MSTDYVPPVIYRIAVLNEFRNNYAFVDFKKFGEMRHWTAGWTAWPHRGYVTKDDRICVFLNYEQLVKTTAKEEALKKVKELIAECPQPMSGFLFEEAYKLYRAIGTE